MSGQPILKKISPEEHMAWLTLNRPEKKNALTKSMMDELIRNLTEISENPEIRVIVLQASGDSFCSGLDLHDLKKDHNTNNRWGRPESTPEIVRLLRLAPQVTIASVRGFCLGGGLAMVHGCDLAVAAESAKLGMPEVLRGSYGAVATPTLFQSRVPNKIAFDIQLTGRNLSGIEAARCGLVSRSVADEDLDRAVDDLARSLAQRHPVVLAHAKIAAYTSLDLPFHLAMQADETIQHRQRYYMDPMADLPDYLESQKGGGNLGYRRPDAK